MFRHECPPTNLETHADMEKWPTNWFVRFVFKPKSL